MSKIDIDKFIEHLVKCGALNYNAVQSALFEQGLMLCNYKIQKIGENSSTQGEVDEDGEICIYSKYKYTNEERKILCEDCDDYTCKLHPTLSKFNIGDWLVANNKDNMYSKIMQVIEIKRNRYGIIRENGHDFPLVEFIDKNYHLWSINDAKEGDILVTNSGIIFIYKCISEGGTIYYHVALSEKANKIYLPKNNEQLGDQEVFPANKEQRELLFSKMREAGYMFDSVGKQMLSLNLEPNNQKQEEKSNKFKEGDKVLYTSPKGYKEYGRVEINNSCVDSLKNKIAVNIGGTMRYYDETELELVIFIPKFDVGDRVHCGDESQPITITDIRNDAYLTDSALGVILFSEEDYWEKVEPKFKGGEWVVDNCGYTWNIKTISNDLYLIEDNEGLESMPTIEWLDKISKPWTIQDAKEGDVLALDVIENYPSPFVAIFKEFQKDNFEFDSYCFIGHNGVFYEGEEGHSIYEIHPATKEQRELLFSKMREAEYEFDFNKKELKKIEAKFKVGNWYQCIKDFFGKGVTFDKNTAYYCAQEGCLQDEYGCHIAIVKDLYDNFRLWTIQDVKEGDVLVDKYSKDKIIILYRGINPNLSVLAYCGWNGYNFSIKTNGLGYGSLDNTKYVPATKEQRDLLFAKMKEAGYKWLAEKKELKKIERNPIEWSKDDKNVLEDIKEAIINYWNGDTQDILLDWLKSLKHRVKPQPKQEWSEEDKKMFRSLHNLIYVVQDCVYNSKKKKELSDWLESLKDRF